MKGRYCGMCDCWEEQPDVQLLAWAVTNCHMLARRALAKSTSVSDREKWEHVLRICEKAGARSKGVLRAAVPTEITEAAPSAVAVLPHPPESVELCTHCGREKDHWYHGPISPPYKGVEHSYKPPKQSILPHPPERQTDEIVDLGVRYAEGELSDVAFVAAILLATTFKEPLVAECGVHAYRPDANGICQGCGGPGPESHWGHAAPSSGIAVQQPCKFLNGRCTICGEPESGMCNRPPEVVAVPPWLDPSNHHNALVCPYCNPKGLKFAEAVAVLQPETVNMTIEDMKAAHDRTVAVPVHSTALPAPAGDLQAIVRAFLAHLGPARSFDELPVDDTWVNELVRLEAELLAALDRGDTR